MRRPYRSVRKRVFRRLEAFGRRLNPPVRHRLRRVSDLVSGNLRGSFPAGPREVVHSFDFWANISFMADASVTALAGAGVGIVRLERDGTVILALPAEARAAAISTLASDPVTGSWWLAPQFGSAQPITRLAAHAYRLRGEAVVTLFRFLIAPDGTSIAGPECGIQLQFWRRVDGNLARPDGGVHETGTRVAPVVNSSAAYITPSLWREAQDDPGRRLRPTAPPHLLSVREPIDIVYTWVDDSDPEWQRRRRSVQPPRSGLSSDALHEGRTRNRDELRYSLRSLEAYASWYRHVWLVTDGQVPNWLADHPRLTVVRHEEIFSDPKSLPTFNSHAIESQLHHIDGLAEHFIYLNDDVFFGRPVRPERFFTGSGLAKFSISPVSIDQQHTPIQLSGAMHAARNNRRLLLNEFGRTVTSRVQHIPHAHRRSSLAQFEARHPQCLAAVARAKFRSDTDLSLASELGHYWAYANGQAITSTLAFRYVDIGSPLALEYLDSLLARRDQDAFCINDAGPYPYPVDYTPVTQFLERYFPVPSSFERVEA